VTARSLDAAPAWPRAIAAEVAGSHERTHEKRGTADPTGFGCSRGAGVRGGWIVKKASILAAALAVFTTGVAETTESPDRSTTTEVEATASRAAAPSASHLKTAAELLELVHVDRNTAETLDVVLKLQLRQQPNLEPYEHTLRAFVQKYMSWESLKGDYARIYADAFSEEELRQMIAFYRTPTGQKAVKMLPELMAKGAALGHSRVQENREELQRMIRSREKEIESHHPVP
jgi:uncharacterized protein